MAAHKRKLFGIYGRNIFRILPKGYRSKHHRAPSRDFVFALCRLANANGVKHPDLADLRLALIAASDKRLSFTIRAKQKRAILLSDVKYAIDLRKACEESDDSSAEDNAVEGLEATDVRFSQPSTVFRVD